MRRLTRRHPLASLGVVVVLAAAVVHVGHAAASSTSTSSAAPGSTAAQVIAYARAQEGCPYVWGGTGPCQAGYDCSGLAMQAYASAGISIERTSQAQWAAGQQVSDPQPGDLVFFAGADGTWSAPGHVGIVTGPNTMIDAYGTGYDITQQSFGLASSAPGLSDPVGFTDPLGGSS